MDRIAERAEEVVSAEAAVALHVTDGRLDGAAAAQLLADRRREAAALAGEEHAVLAWGVGAAIPGTDVDPRGRRAGRACTLTGGAVVGVAFIGMPWPRHNA